LHLAETAAKDGIDLAGGPVRMLIVAGEPGGSIPETRRRIESAWGARVIDHSGMTEIGPLAVECWDQPGGLHVLEGDYIVEVIEPMGSPIAPRVDDRLAERVEYIQESARLVAPGQIGELVLTNLTRTGSPLFRYRTGDLVQIDSQPCPCGSIFIRLKGGVLGRVDDMIHLRGNNVYPSAIENLLRRFSEVAEYRLVVEETATLTNLRIEIEPMPSADGAILVERIGKLLRDELLFRAEVVSVKPGSLPRFEMKAKRLIHRSRADDS